MNAFANTLFSILLSWVKTLAQALWDLVSGGGANGFFIWLGDHWLPLVVFLCLCGVAADMLIWLLRWRPDLVWRTRWRHFFARVSGREMRASEQRVFQQGYQDGLDMQEGYALYQDAWQQESENQQDVPQDAPWWEVADAAPAYQEEDVSAWQPVYETQAWGSAPESAQPAPRRRRSDKYQKTEKTAPIRRIRGKIREAREDDEAMLDGLPPIVDKDQAFHAPVYPKREYTEP